MKGVTSIYRCREILPQYAVKFSHRLGILTNIPYSKVNFNWTEIKKYAFDEIKQIAARDNLLAYLDFIEEPKIHIDASDLQLGVVAIQKVKPIASYGRRITDPQKRYKVT